jgi:hypothetical protein
VFKKDVIMKLSTYFFDIEAIIYLFIVYCEKKWLYLLLACVSKGCYNEAEHIFILVSKPLFIILLFRSYLVHFQANVTLKEKFGYQEPFYIKTKAIKD